MGLEPIFEVLLNNNFDHLVDISETLLYYELLEPKQSIVAVRLSQQLRRLTEKKLEKRSRPGYGNREVILLHDNPRFHVALRTKETFLELSWEVLPHPAYSPDIAPSDFHLFRSMEYFLRNKSLKKIKIYKIS